MELKRLPADRSAPPVRQESERRAPRRRADRLARGQIVVHPQHGIGVIEGIEERTIDGDTTSYLVLKGLVPALTVLVPEDSPDALGLRLPMTRAEAGEALQVLGRLPSPMPPYGTHYARTISQAVHSGEPSTVAAILRDLVGKQDRKGLSYTERYLLRRATELLSSEVAVALRISPERASARIAEVLANACVANGQPERASATRP
ncbi:MAG: CarD family transcriptional regulator [Actinomycetota bacterium]